MGGRPTSRRSRSRGAWSSGTLTLVWPSTPRHHVALAHAGPDASSRPVDRSGSGMRAGVPLAHPPHGHMLRITELRLPLDHSEPELRAAIVTRLGVPDAALKSMTVYRRAVDARKRSAMVLTYTIDCDVHDEEAVLSGSLGRSTPEAARRTRVTASSGMRRRLTTRRSVRGRSSSASDRAASSRRWCWRRWACDRSCWSAASACASARRTPGGCGARAC